MRVYSPNSYLIWEWGGSLLGEMQGGGRKENGVANVLRPPPEYVSYVSISLHLVSLILDQTGFWRD